MTAQNQYDFYPKGQYGSTGTMNGHVKDQSDADFGIYEEEYEYEEQYTESPYQYQPQAVYSNTTAMNGHMVPPPPPPPPRQAVPQTPMQQQQRQGHVDGQPLSGAASPLSAAAMSIGDLDELLDGEDEGDEAFGYSADCIHVPTFATYEWGSNSFASNNNNGCGDEEEEEDMDVQEGSQSYCSSFVQNIVAPKPVSSSGFSSMSFCDPSARAGAGDSYMGEAQHAYSLDMATVDHSYQQQYYQQQQYQQHQGGGFASAFMPSSSFCGNR